MSTALGASAYIDVPAYLRAPTNQETASLLGLNTTIGGSVSTPAGATTLPVAASASWAAGPLWLLDGPYSEVVQVAAAPDGTHLTLAAPGTRFDHAPGVSASQAGASGSLAELLLRASAWIEGYCRQGTSATDRSLFAVSRTERWDMPSSRAALDRDGVLALRPGHFPVLSVAALSVEFGQGDTLGFDVSQLELPSYGRLIEAPYLLASAATPGLLLALESAGLSRSRRQWATVTYTGGVPTSAVPYDLQQACIWIASDLLAVRRNPSGAAMVRQGAPGQVRVAGPPPRRHHRRLHPHAPGHRCPGALPRARWVRLVASESVVIRPGAQHRHVDPHPHQHHRPGEP